jgi:methylenetetrahydrofolate dehydrogenase (NADP+) / methenyltetrahydrofolate cyclohydrolase
MIRYIKGVFMILDGKKFATTIKQNLKAEVEIIKQRLNFTPKLATILVGDNVASKAYVNMKIKACAQIGLASVLVHISEQTTTDELLAKIDELNKDREVCGILLQHPVPTHIDEAACFNKIIETKDVDGTNTSSFGKMAMGQRAFKPATPLGIIMLLEHYNITLEGKHALVIGRSQILGKPLTSLLLNKNATVTIAHSKTSNLNDLLKRADIVLACVGKAKFIKASELKAGVVIIDAGYNEGVIGDVDLDGAQNIASYYTPVPGGVGPMTIAALLTQTVQAAKNLIK